MPLLKFPFRNKLPLCDQNQKTRGNVSSVLSVCSAFLHGFLFNRDAFACPFESLAEFVKFYFKFQTKTFAPSVQLRHISISERDVNNEFRN